MKLVTIPILLVVLSSLLGCNAPEKEITVYLKNTDGTVLKVPDCEIAVISENTLRKILDLRQKVKLNYPFALLSDERVEELKKNGYDGLWHPKEIDEILPFLATLSAQLKVENGVLTQEAGVNELMAGSAHGELMFELKNDWERASSSTVGLARIQQFLKASMPADEAAKVGKEALEIIKNEAKGVYKTTIEGKALIQCPKDSFLWIYCLVEGTYIAWIVPVADLPGSSAEINQSKAFIIERIPQNVAELHEDLATMTFFYGSTSFGGRNALPASLVSDEFYQGAKLAMGEWNEEKWRIKFGE